MHESWDSSQKAAVKEEANILLASSHSSMGWMPSAEVESCSVGAQRIQQQLFLVNTINRHAGGEQDRQTDLHPAASGPPPSSHRAQPDAVLFQTPTVC